MKKFNRYIAKEIQKDPDLKQEMEFALWISLVGLNIARLRKERGYTQKKFAQKLGISQSAVARIESGQNMQCSTVWTISDVLETGLAIFGADKETEKRKFAYFYTNVKEKIVGATSETKAIKYSTAAKALLLPSNFNVYATA
ncbi:helix-turn-helix transcriptional regulator [Candidatus Peregrinibacteria bacterium]|nr:helix-turn-helix transcriptional regulator [Candidatus Peregrinibacteria bacterium]